MADDGIDQARQALAAALDAGDPSAIALAEWQVANALAEAGEHEQAVAAFQHLLSYLAMAHGDDTSATQRKLRILSSAAPPPGPDDVDPGTLATAARIALAESLLILGRRDEARTQLDRAAIGTRGFGRGWLRKRRAAVARRMEQPGTAPSDDRPGREWSAAEQVAAADELLAQDRPADAARAALAAISACDPADPLLRGQARHVLGMALDTLGQAEDSRVVLRDSHADYLAADEYDAAADIAVALAWRLAAADARDDAMGLLSLTLAEIPATSPQRVRLLTDLGSLQDQDGQPEAARTTLSGALATAETTGDELAAADARHGLAVVLANHPDGPEDSVEALSLLEECRRTYGRAGYPDRVSGCDHEAAALLGRLGSRDAAAARYQQALTGYLALPEEMRDTGQWPDEVADCRLNLAALADAAEPSDPRLFQSGGHTMSHGN